MNTTDRIKSACRRRLAALGMSRLTERGFSSVELLIGAVIGLAVIGGFGAYWMVANSESQDTQSRTMASAETTKVLSRVSRSVSDANVIQKAQRSQIVLLREDAKANTWKRTWYRIPSSLKTVETAVVEGTGTAPAYGGGNPPASAWKTIARNIKVGPNSQFSYADKNGNIISVSDLASTDPSTISRVDAELQVETKRGATHLKTSAAVDSRETGSVNVAGLPPSAEDVEIEVVFGSSASASLNSYVFPPEIAGVYSFAITTNSTPSGLNVTTNTAGNIVVTVPTTYTGPMGLVPVNWFYTATDTRNSLVSNEANITLRINPANVTAVAPTLTPVSCGPNNDIIRVANTTGVQYRVNGTNVSPGGTATVSGSTTVTAVARPGYALTNPSASWGPYTDNDPICATALAPTLNKVTCAPNNDRVVIPNVAGIQYQVNGSDVFSGSTVTVNGTTTVTATAMAGYVLNPGTTSWTYTDNDPICVTASAPPAPNRMCGPNNDTVTIPSVTGVRYEVDGTPVGNGTTHVITGSITVTAHHRAGYTLNPGTTSWTYTDAAVGCNVRAYTTTIPNAANVTTANIRVQWEGGPLSWARHSGPSAAPVVASGDETADSGILNLEVPMGASYDFTAGGTTDRAATFPFAESVHVQGSDTNADGTADNIGTNQVRRGSTPAGGRAAGTLFELFAFTSTAGPSSGYGMVDTGSARVVPVAGGDFGTPCVGVSGGAGSCYLDSADRGTEWIYSMGTYNRVWADADGNDADDARAAGNPGLANQLEAAMVTRGAHSYYPSVNARLAERTDGQKQLLYTNGTLNGVSDIVGRAYQSPVKPTAVSGGNASADGCSDVDGVRLVANHPDTRDNGIYHCDNGQASIDYTAYGDHGNRTTSAGPFCDYTNSAGCSVTVRRNSSTPADYVGKASSTAKPSESVDVAQSGWLVTDPYQVRACNAGGCGGMETTSLQSFVGKLWISRVRQPIGTRYQSHNYYVANGSNTSAQDRSQINETLVQWSAAPGATAANSDYSWWAETVRGQDASNAAGMGASRAWFPRSNVNVGADLNTGYLVTSVSTVYGFRARVSPRDSAVAAGFEGKMWRDATSIVSGKRETTVATSPPPVTWFQDTGFCNPSINNGWKFGVRMRREARGPNGSVYTSDVTTDPLRHYIRYFWWAGRTNTSETSNATDHLAGFRWRANPNRPSSWAAPGSWTNTLGTGSRGTEYYATDVENIPATANTYSLLVGPREVDVIPPDYGVGYFRSEVYFTEASAGYPDFGDLSYWAPTWQDLNNTETQAGANGELNTADTDGGLSRHFAGRTDGSNAIGATHVANCGTSSGPGKWAGSMNWWAIRDGIQVTRTAHKTSGAPNSPSAPGNTGWRGWNQVG